MEIQTKHTAGKVTEGHARALLRIGRNTAISMLMAVKGLSPLSAKESVKTVLAAVHAPVNETLGWALIER